MRLRQGGFYWKRLKGDRARARVTSGFRDLAGGADDISANNIGGAKVAKVESRDEKSAV